MNAALSWDPRVPLAVWNGRPRTQRQRGLGEREDGRLVMPWSGLVTLLGCQAAIPISMSFHT